MQIITLNKILLLFINILLFNREIFGNIPHLLIKN